MDAINEALNKAEVVGVLTLIAIFLALIAVRLIVKNK